MERRTEEGGGEQWPEEVPRRAFGIVIGENRGGKI